VSRNRKIDLAEGDLVQLKKVKSAVYSGLVTRVKPHAALVHLGRLERSVWMHVDDLKLLVRENNN